MQATGAGQTDFGWADTPAVLAGVDQGVKVKSLGVFLQTTPASVQSFASQNIKSPADLKGKTIAGTAGDALSKTFPIFLKKNGLAESDVKVQNTDPAGKIAAVMSGKTDSLLGYASDQGPTMQDKAKKDVSYLPLLRARPELLLRRPHRGPQDPSGQGRSGQAHGRRRQRVLGRRGEEPRARRRLHEGRLRATPPETVLSEQFKTTLTLLHTDATQGKAPGANTEADWQQTIDVFAQAGMVKNPKPVADYWDSANGIKG